MKIIAIWEKAGKKSGVFVLWSNGEFKEVMNDKGKPRIFAVLDESICFEFKHANFIMQHFGGQLVWKEG